MPPVVVQISQNFLQHNRSKGTDKVQRQLISLIKTPARYLCYVVSPLTPIGVSHAESFTGGIIFHSRHLWLPNFIPRHL